MGAAAAFPDHMYALPDDPVAAGPAFAVPASSSLPAYTTLVPGHAGGAGRAGRGGHESLLDNPKYGLPAHYIAGVPPDGVLAPAPRYARPMLLQPARGTRGIRVLHVTFCDLRDLCT